MLKFNSGNLIVGEIKELLASFNLPKYRIYTNDDEIIPTVPHQFGSIHGTYLHKHKHASDEYEVQSSQTKAVVPDTYGGIAPDNMNYTDYIKDGKIQRYVNDQWLNSGKTYMYNKPEANHTKNLIIKNAIYDSDTHEYLGDYLRFKRDHDNLNFMGMYNCFSNRACQKLDFTENSGYEGITFTTDDNQYKIYMLPVKLFRKYTIAIDSEQGAEICCGMYDNYQDSREKFKELPGLTFKKYNKLLFRNPVLYTKLAELTTTYIQEKELAQDEEILKMFIKIPYNNKSSIAILEGDYTNYSETNHSVINTDYLDADDRKISGTVSRTINAEYQKVKLYTPLQLLKYNTGESYPIADRLFEFLCGNMITDEDELPDDIKRVQKVVAKNTKEPAPYTAKPYYGTSAGLWDYALNIQLYSYMFEEKNRIPNYIKYDITGFVDKDVEKYFGYRNNSDDKMTLTNVNLYAELYPITRPGKEE